MNTLASAPMERRIAKRTAIFAAALLALGTITFLRADALSSQVYILDQRLVGTACNEASSNSTPLSCTGEWTTPITSGENTVTFGGSAYAAAGYGLLHSASSGVASCDLQPGINCYGLAGNAHSSAGFVDEFTITGATHSGYLDFSVVADGTGHVTCAGDAATAICGGGASYGIASLSVYGPALVNGISQSGTGLNPGTNDVNVWVPFSALGGVAEISTGLTLSTLIQCYAARNTTCAAYANFSNTAYVNGLSVLDASGNPVTGALVTAASGTDYNNIQTPAAVPEPSQIMVLSLGLLAMAWFRMRSIKRRRSLWRS